MRNLLTIQRYSSGPRSYEIKLIVYGQGHPLIPRFRVPAMSIGLLKVKAAPAGYDSSDFLIVKVILTIVIW